MLNNIKDEFNMEVTKYARSNIIKKLKKQGIDYQELEESVFDELVNDEIEILKNDSKKVGMGIGIGLAISLLTGI